MTEGSCAVGAAEERPGISQVQKKAFIRVKKLREVWEVEVGYRQTALKKKKKKSKDSLNWDKRK